MNNNFKYTTVFHPKESNVLDEFVIELTVESTRVMERRIRFILKDRPRYIPEKLWFKMASKFLRIEDEYSS